MSAAGLGAIGSFAGGLAGGLSQGTQDALRRLQAQAQKAQLNAEPDVGQTLLQAYTGSPGVVSPSVGQGPMGQLGGLLKGLFAGGAPGQGGQSQPGAPLPLTGTGATPPRGSTPRSPMLGQPPQGMPMSGTGGQPLPAQPPSVAAPTMGGGVPPQAGAIQQMSLPAIVAAWRKANTGPDGNLTKSPADLVHVLNGVMPFMNAQASAEYRQIMLGQSQQRIGIQGAGEQERTRHDQATERQGEQRIGLAAERLKGVNERFDATQEANRAKLEGAKTKDEFDQAARDMREAQNRKIRAINAITAANNSPDSDDKTAALAAARLELAGIDREIDEAGKKYEGSRTKMDAPASSTGENGAGGRAPPEVVIGKRVPTGNAGAAGGGKVESRALSPADAARLKTQAKEAIDAGIPRDAVIQKLKEMGGDPSGL